MVTVDKMTPKEKDICAQWWADMLEIEEKKEIFKGILYKYLHNDMALHVDYDPDETLLDALHEAGIDCRGGLFSHKGIFPPKIGMRIRQHDNTIKAKKGYGAGWETLA